VLCNHVLVGNQEGWQSVGSVGYQWLRVRVLDISILGWSGAVGFECIWCIRGVG